MGPHDLPTVRQAAGHAKHQHGYVGAIWEDDDGYVQGDGQVETYRQNQRFLPLPLCGEAERGVKGLRAFQKATKERGTNQEPRIAM